MSTTCQPYHQTFGLVVWLNAPKVFNSYPFFLKTTLKHLV
jgi:hypothetical protein